MTPAPSGWSLWFNCAAWIGVLVAQQPAPALADDPPPFSRSGVVMVSETSASVMAAEKVLAEFPPGTVLRYSKENGPWLLIPRHRGWIKRTAVLPIELAEDHYSSILAERPTADAFHHRGIARLETGKLPEAIADFNEAQARNPKDAAVLVNRGVARLRSGNPDAALQEFTAALQIDPDELLALINRSSLLLERGQPDAALIDIEAILAVDPGSAEALVNRGVARRLQGRLDEALADYNLALQAWPEYAEALANRGYVRKALGDHAAALEDYERALQLAPELSAVMNDAAWLLATCPDESVRNPQRAVQLAEQAAALAPKNGDYLDTLAAAYAAAGRFEDAIARAEAALPLLGEADRGPVSARIEDYRRQRPFVETRNAPSN
ncbi:MAG: tetratricopeptide repeat protein [Planctomyces sp.]|nr:tetratricopeptide repeat protein [Planctomyces sp.]